MPIEIANFNSLLVLSGQREHLPSPGEPEDLNVIRVRGNMFSGGHVVSVLYRAIQAEEGGQFSITETTASESTADYSIIAGTKHERTVPPEVTSKISEAAITTQTPAEAFKAAEVPSSTVITHVAEKTRDRKDKAVITAHRGAEVVFAAASSDVEAIKQQLAVAVAAKQEIQTRREDWRKERRRRAT